MLTFFEVQSEFSIKTTTKQILIRVLKYLRTSQKFDNLNSVHVDDWTA